MMLACMRMRSEVAASVQPSTTLAKGTAVLEWSVLLARFGVEASRAGCCADQTGPTDKLSQQALR